APGPAGPVIAVPRALLHRAAVPVIVEMTDASQRALPLPPTASATWAAPTAGRRPARGRLSPTAVRAHLLAVLRAEHARGVYAFHLVPQIAATVPGVVLPRLLAQP